MHKVLQLPWTAGIRAIHCSTERKAIDGAAILADALGLGYAVWESLGENDRSATGYLSSVEFETTADAFFARPDESVRGWERAVDAQRRIIDAMSVVRDMAAGGGDTAVVSHGGVGALYLCHVKNCPISRQEDQPRTNGGNYYAFDSATGRLHHGWQAIDT
jgi:broad specificity phosphatase PhoE